MKYVKNFLIIVITIIILALLVNFFAFIYVIRKGHTGLNSAYKILSRKNFSIEKFMQNQEFLKPKGTQYTQKASLLLFGCGMAEGIGIQEGKTFDTILSEYTKRTVYNRALASGYIQHSIAQVQSHDIDDLIKKSSHAIYLLPSFIDSSRLFVYPGDLMSPYFLLNEDLYLKYLQTKDNQLQQYVSICPIITGSIFHRLWEKSKYEYTNSTDLKMAILHFITLNQELKKVNPNIQLDLLIYYDSIKNFSLKYCGTEHKLFTTNMEKSKTGCENGVDKEIYKNTIEEIRKSGINVIELSSLTNIDLIKEAPYHIENKYDPSAEAWKLLVPKIAKELKL